MTGMKVGQLKAIMESIPDDADVIIDSRFEVENAHFDPKSGISGNELNIKTGRNFDY